MHALIPFRKRLFFSALWIFSVLGSLAFNAHAAANYPFPQNRDQPFGNHPAIYSNSDIQNDYTKWKNDCITTTGAGGFQRVQRPNDSGLLLNSTVSEGIGYGLLIAVYMNDETLFDNLWKYEQLHLDGSGLMNWYIDASGGTAGGGAATDADEDMAWGLLMAGYQWGGSGSLSDTYRNLAVAQINRIYGTEVSNSIPVAGDGFGAINPSYFAPAYYKIFAQVTGNTGWNSVADQCYVILNDNLGQGYGNANNGLDSAWCDSAGVSQNSVGSNYTDYQYDACRTPFRIGLDYLFNGDSRAQTYCTKTSNFFSGIGAANIQDGYALSGTPDPQLPTLTASPNAGFQSAAFLGPAGVGSMISGNYQQFMDAMYAQIKNMDKLVGGTYYDECWTLMAMLVMTGNFLDYTKYQVPTPTPTFNCGLVTCTPTPTVWTAYDQRVNCADSAFTDGLSQVWAADQAFTAGGWGYTVAGNTADHTGVVITGATNNQDQLYRNERYSNPQYVFTVPAGYYKVTLKLAENYYTSANQRVFSVTGNGVPIVTNLDLYAATGATDKAYDAVVDGIPAPSGSLTLIWNSTVADGKANAIEVARSTYQPPSPTVTGTPTATKTVTRTYTPQSPTGTPTRTGTPTPTLTPNPCAAAVARVNCGGSAYTDSTGNVWSTDQAWATGSWGYVSGTAASTTQPISGTTDDTLYQSERYGNPFEYRFTVPNGNYQVSLKFVERNFASSGQRIFSVLLNGVTVVSNLDIYAEVGEYAADDKGPFLVTVSGGALTVIGNASVNNAEVAAIEIKNAASQCTATPTGQFTSTRTPTATVSSTSTASSTPTRTGTFTSTATSTPTPSPTFTRSATPSVTPTPTATATATRTVTFTASPTPSATASFTSTATRSMTPTASATPTASPTNTTVSNTATNTSTLTPTNTPSSTYSATRTPTVTPTNTRTNTLTSTATPTNTSVPNTATSTSTLTSTNTYTLTRTPTATPTNTVTSTATPTLTPTATSTPTLTPTATNTSTPTSTRTNTPTTTASATWTPTSTSTNTSTSSATHTASPTASPTNTPTVTSTFTITSTPTWSATGTLPPSATASPTPTLSSMPTGTNTYTVSYTSTLSSTPTSTSSVTNTRTTTFTTTNTPTSTRTWTPTLTSSPTNTFTATATRTMTSTASPTVTVNLTSTYTPPALTSTFTATPTGSPTSSATASRTSTPTGTATASLTRTDTWTPTSTQTQTGTSTGTATPSLTATATQSPSPSPTSSSTSTGTPSPTTTWTPTISYTPSITNTGTLPPTATATATPSATITPTWSPTASPSVTPTQSYTWTPTGTSTSSLTPSVTFTYTASRTATTTDTPTPPALTFTPTSTNTSTVSPTVSATPTRTLTATPTFSNTPSATATASPSSTASDSPTSTRSFTSTETSSPSPTWTRTATPTATGTATPTPTSTTEPSSTPTASPATTATATVAAGDCLPTVSVPYPNPVLGTAAYVALDVKSPCPQNLRWAVFTAAYRKVAEGTKTVSDGDQIRWNLTDGKGGIVSNGVYFMRIEGNGRPFIAKIMVLR